MKRTEKGKGLKDRDTEVLFQLQMMTHHVIAGKMGSYYADQAVDMEKNINSLLSSDMDTETMMQGLTDMLRGVQQVPA